MTEFNNKFTPNTPRTYEVRYVEKQERSELVKFASYLGTRVIYCSPQDNGGSGAGGAGGGGGSSGGSSVHTVHVDVNKAASNYASDQSYQLRSEGRDGGCNIL